MAHYTDKEYMKDVPCWRCTAVGSVEWRGDAFYCRVCGKSQRGMVPVTLRSGEAVWKEWRGTGLVF